MKVLQSLWGVLLIVLIVAGQVIAFPTGLAMTFVGLTFGDGTGNESGLAGYFLFSMVCGIVVLLGLGSWLALKYFGI